MITHSELLRIIDYDALTGLFRWKVSRSNQIRAGDLAGSVSISHGYIYIEIDGQSYRASILAWFYTKGEWPPLFVDHKDGDKSNNVLTNLRLATRSQNNANARLRKDSSSGFKGVSYVPRLGKFRAYTRENGKHKHIGVYNTAEAAHEAYLRASKERYGEFARGE